MTVKSMFYMVMKSRHATSVMFALSYDLRHFTTPLLWAKEIVKCPSGAQFRISPEVGFLNTINFYEYSWQTYHSFTLNYILGK